MRHRIDLPVAGLRSGLSRTGGQPLRDKPLTDRRVQGAPIAEPFPRRSVIANIRRGSSTIESAIGPVKTVGPGLAQGQRPTDAITTGVPAIAFFLIFQRMFQTWHDGGSGQ
jgi:hypothetical protein